MIYPVKVAASAALAMLCLPSALYAGPLSEGSFGVAGAATLAQGHQLASADSIFIGNGGSVFVTSPGTFDLLGAGSIGARATLRDIPSLTTFGPLSGFLTASNGTTVDLLSLTVVHRSTNFLNFYGDVELLAPGFDATRGILSGAATTLDGRSLSLTLSISARPGAGRPDAGLPPEQPPASREVPAEEETVAAVQDPAPAAIPVPEPWSVAALAFGLGAFAHARRRKDRT
jgi:hypothetical protein